MRLPVKYNKKERTLVDADGVLIGDLYCFCPEGMAIADSINMHHQLVFAMENLLNAKYVCEDRDIFKACENLIKLARGEET